MPNLMMNDLSSLVEINKDDLPWCLAPFIATAYMFNDVAPCCETISLTSTSCTPKPGSAVEIMNSEALKNTRKAFMNFDYDAIPGDCKRCLNSPTTHSAFYTVPGHEEFIRTYLEYKDKFREDGSIDKYPLTYMTLAIDNKCNAACRMCYPIISSAKFELVKKAGLASNDGGKDTVLGFDDTYIPIDIKQCVELLEYHKDTLREIVLQGGDPVQSQYLEVVLRTLLPCKDRIKIIFFSNGTFDTLPDGRLLWDLLDQFYSLDIRFSIDSIPEVNEYVRIGVKSKRALKLLIRCKEYFEGKDKKNVGIHATLSNYTICYLPEFLDWVDENVGLTARILSINGVIRPITNAPHNLPPELKNHVLSKFKAYTPKNAHAKKIIKTAKVLLFNNPFNQSHWNTCLWMDKKQDAITGMSFPLFEPYKQNLIEITNWDKQNYE